MKIAILTDIEQPKLCQFTFCKCMFEFSRHFISSKRGRRSLIASTHGIYVVNQPRSTSVWLQKLLSLLLQSNDELTSNRNQVAFTEKFYGSIFRHLQFFREMGPTSKVPFLSNSSRLPLCTYFSIDVFAVFM